MPGLGGSWHSALALGPGRSWVSRRRREVACREGSSTHVAATPLSYSAQAVSTTQYSPKIVGATTHTTSRFIVHELHTVSADTKPFNRLGTPKTGSGMPRRMNLLDKYLPRPFASHASRQSGVWDRALHWCWARSSSTSFNPRILPGLSSSVAWPLQTGSWDGFVPRVRSGPPTLSSLGSSTHVAATPLSYSAQAVSTTLVEKHGPSPHPETVGESSQPNST